MVEVLFVLISLCLFKHESVLINNCIAGLNTYMSILKYEPGYNVSMKSDDKYDGRVNTSSILFVQENIYKFGLDLYKKVKRY